MQNRSPLAPSPLIPLPLGAIRPQGWLLDQLQIQAEASGRLSDYWPDLGANSGWLGGTGEDWERGPYYLDGLLPLAYLLADERLLAKVKPWIEWCLQSQGEDGQFGPRTNDDWWPRMVMLKVLTQYQEATGDERVIPFLQRYCRYQAAQIRSRPLSKWGAARGGENLACLYWLYNRTGEAYLLDLAREVHRQTIDWTELYTAFPLVTWQPRVTTGMLNHVVNNAMAVKEPALFWQLSGEERYRQGAQLALSNLMQYHGLAHGMFSGDELLAGPLPSQGVETCAVVEFMYSLEHLLRVFGDPALADMLEKVAFNALPAPFTDDMFGHQYDQQPNQVLCTVAERHWTNNGKESNLFGLEPNFGCCTANYHQGWPKLTSSLWAATADGGLAALVYAPCVVKTRVAAGTDVQVTVTTAYPFRESVQMALSLPAPARFALALRIPGWCRNAAVTVNGQPVADVSPEAGSLCRIERLWQEGDVVELTLPMSVTLQDRPATGGVTVERGPLVYALAVGTEWRRLRGEEPSPYWELYPTTSWNYGLLVDRDCPERSFRVETGPIGPVPFAAAQPPVRLVGQGRLILEWGLAQNSAGPLPPSPVAATTPVTALTLIPFGAAKLRIAEFPRVTAE